MRLTVYGLPRPQGSKSARVVNGQAILTEGFGEKPRQLKAWRASIAAEARAWLAQHGAPAPIDGPVELHATFYLPRPKSARKRTYPHTKPDCSKLLRAIEDALSKIIYTDDARIVSLFVNKRYANETPPRVEIFVRALAGEAA